MEFKNFAGYIRGKSMDKLLHRARKSSLSRISAGESVLPKATRKMSPSKRASGSR